MGSRSGYRLIRPLSKVPTSGASPDAWRSADEVLDARGHDRRDGAQGVVGAQAPPEQLVARDGRALELGEPRQRLVTPGAAQPGQQRVEVRARRVLR